MVVCIYMMESWLENVGVPITIWIVVDSDRHDGSNSCLLARAQVAGAFSYRKIK